MGLNNRTVRYHVEGPQAIAAGASIDIPGDAAAFELLTTDVDSLELEIEGVQRFKVPAGIVFDLRDVEGNAARALKLWNPTGAPATATWCRGARPWADNRFLISAANDLAVRPRQPMANGRLIDFAGDRMPDLSQGMVDDAGPWVPGEHRCRAFQITGVGIAGVLTAADNVNGAIVYGMNFWMAGGAVTDVGRLEVLNNVGAVMGALAQIQAPIVGLADYHPRYTAFIPPTYGLQAQTLGGGAQRFTGTVFWQLLL